MRCLPLSARRALAAAFLPALAIALGCVSTTAAAGVCYSVYGPDDAVLYQASQPPVDMSGNVSERVAKLWPRARLVWFATDSCPVVLPNTLADAAALRGGVDPLRTVDEGVRVGERPAPARATGK